MWSVVTESPSTAEDARARRCRRRRRLAGMPVEIGRRSGRRSIRVPLEGVALRHSIVRQWASPLKTVGVSAREHLLWSDCCDRLGDLALGRPDVAQVDRLAASVDAERLAAEVDLHRAGERIGDDQRRRGEVVGATSALTRPSKLRLPESTAAATRSPSLTALEISAGSGPELPMQVVQPKPTRLKPSASSGSVSPASLEIVGDHLRAGRQRRLHPRLLVSPRATAFGRAARRRPSRAGSRCWCST